jgi:hypothetical protein
MLGHRHTDRTYMTSTQGFRFLLPHVRSADKQKSVLRFRLIYTFQAKLNNNKSYLECHLPDRMDERLANARTVIHLGYLRVYPS